MEAGQAPSFGERPKRRLRFVSEEPRSAGVIEITLDVDVEPINC